MITSRICSGGTRKLKSEGLKSVKVKFAGAGQSRDDLELAVFQDQVPGDFAVPALKPPHAVKLVKRAVEPGVL